jgi:hypothetical protein
MSTLGETNNAQFFPYLKVVRLIATQGAAPVDPPITQVGSLVQLEFPAPTCRSRKRCLTNWGIEEHEFWLLDLSNCSNGSCLWRTFAVYLQTELNDGAHASSERCPYSPPVSIDDRPADREPHTHTLGLGGVEGVE